MTHLSPYSACITSPSVFIFMTSLFLFNNNGSFISKASLGENEETEDIQAELNHLLNLRGILGRAAACYNHLQKELGGGGRGADPRVQTWCAVCYWQIIGFKEELESSAKQRKCLKTEMSFYYQSILFLYKMTLNRIWFFLNAVVVLLNLHITLDHFSCLNVVFEWNQLDKSTETCKEKYFVISNDISTTYRGIKYV